MGRLGCDIGANGQQTCDREVDLDLSALAACESNLLRAATEQIRSILLRATINLSTAATDHAKLLHVAPSTAGIGPTQSEER
jgi:hypothetical protein